MSGSVGSKVTRTQKFNCLNRGVFMMYVSNAFSLQMVAPENLDQVRFEALHCQPDLRGLRSIVGHADIAAVLGVAMDRSSVTLEKGDSMVVAQLVGGRLPEGCKTLPEGFRLQWVFVEVA